MDEVLQLTRKVDYRLKGMIGFQKKKEDKDAELRRFKEFNQEMADFVTTLQEEREETGAEIEQLVALKKDLLAQLHELLPEDPWGLAAAMGTMTSAPPLPPPAAPPRGTDDS